MQVFKAFFKVLNKYKGQMIMYICIFSGMMGAFIKGGTNSEKTYETRETEYIVFDYDNSEASKALSDYMEKNHEHKKTQISDDMDEIRDALYNRSIAVVVRIPEGFEKNLQAGNSENLLEIIGIPGMNDVIFFESDVNSYINTVSMFLRSDFSVKDAVAKANEADSLEVSVSLPKKDSNIRSGRYSFFAYLGWILVVMIIVGITPVIQVFEKKNIRERIEVSSYKFMNMNKELVAGVFVTGLGICAIIGLEGLIFLNKKIFNLEGAISVLNMLVYMIVAVAISFLVSKCTQNESILSMIANVVSLGMAFLCGIFVPIQYLSEGVLNVAHFLPAYWYNQACLAIESDVHGNMANIFGYMGIELLFAVAIAVCGLLVARRKRAN